MDNRFTKSISGRIGHLPSSEPDNTGFAQLDGEDFPEFETGSVWLVGAGPGAPGLLTLLGYHALNTADVVIYDALVNDKLLDWTRDDCQTVYAGKRGGKPSPEQGDISLKLIEFAKAGKRVLRLKGGDPFVFGRGGEECQMLARAQIPYRIVPGISAGIGGLGYAGIPVTHRETNHSVIFLTGHDASGNMPASVDWKAVAQASPVIVLYMALKNFADISSKLISYGRDGNDRVAIVSDATLPHQKITETTLYEAASTLDTAPIPKPAIIVIGAVGEMQHALDWYVDRARENQIG